MIWWGIFIVLSVALEMAFRRVVPLEHRNNYARCRKGRDYYAAVILYHQIWIVAAVQSIVAGEAVPLWQRIGGAIFFILGNALVIWAKAVNNLFVPALIYVPPHLRVKRGPYAAMDHPGYCGFALAAHGIFFLLGQWWAVAPMLAYQLLILRRAIIEDKFLSQPL